MDNSGLAALLALGAVIAVVVIIILLAVYIYTAVALMAIAKRTKTKNGWLAFIPIANFYLIAVIAKQPWWYMFGFLFAFIPVVGVIGVLAWIIFLWWKVAEVVKRPGWYGILMAIPLVNLVVIGIMAWGKK
jgi:hypothetical protein